MNSSPSLLFVCLRLCSREEKVIFLTFELLKRQLDVLYLYRWGNGLKAKALLIDKIQPLLREKGFLGLLRAVL